jgi:nitric oxide reductase activation protein
VDIHKKLLLILTDGEPSDVDADDYVQEIFGNQYTVIDKVESLPEKLPQLFMALTK